MNVRKDAKTNRTRIAQGTVSAVLHLLAYVSLVLDENQVPHIHQLATQLPILFVLSFVISLLCMLPHRQTLMLMFVTARLLLVSIISYGLATNIGPQVFLVASVIVDSVFVLSVAGTIGVSVLSVAVSFIIRQPVSVWDTVNPGLDSGTKLLLAGALVMCAVMAVAIRICQERLKESLLNLDRLRSAVQSLSRANQGFQNYAISAKESAAIDERNRITRDVHDSVGYSLTNILMMARLGSRLVKREPQKLEEIMTQIFCQAQDGLNEMRSALRILRAQSQEPAHGLNAIHRLISAFEVSTGVHVGVDFANAGWKEGGDFDTLVFRFIQEGITNSFRHGHATKIRIAFWQDEVSLHLHISDNGAGSSNAQQGIGLSGMQERITAIGGRLQTNSNKHGFVVRAELPLTKKMKAGVDAYPTR